MSIYDELKIKIDSLAIFSSVKDDPAVAALRRLLDANSVAAYSEFIELLYPEGASLSAYIRKLVLEDDNFYVKAVAAGKKIDPEIVAAVKNELGILTEISQIPSADIRQMVLDSNDSNADPLLCRSGRQRSAIWSRTSPASWRISP